MPFFYYTARVLCMHNEISTNSWQISTNLKNNSISFWHSRGNAASASLWICSVFAQFCSFSAKTIVAYWSISANLFMRSFRSIFGCVSQSWELHLLLIFANFQFFFTEKNVDFLLKSQKTLSVFKTDKGKSMVDFHEVLCKKHSKGLHRI